MVFFINQLIVGSTWAELSDRGGSGQGLMVKWGYVFVCNDTEIDVIKISDSSVTDGWQTIDTDALWHPMLVSKNDGKIYGVQANTRFQ